MFFCPHSPSIHINTPPPALCQRTAFHPLSPPLQAAENVQVVIRMRPKSQAERGAPSLVSITSDTTVNVVSGAVFALSRALLCLSRVCV